MSDTGKTSQHTKQVPTWSDSDLSSFTQRERFAPHLLLAVICTFFLVASVWANFATLDEITRGEGKVVTASQVQVVQNMEGGIVTEILIKEGDPVEKDQILMRIDDTRFSSAFREGHQASLALKAKVARLQAEVYKKQFAIPPEVAKEDPSLAQNEMSLYRARQLELKAKNDVLQQQMVQRRQELVEMQSRQEQLKQGFDLVQRELTIIAPLVKEGVTSEIELLRLKREATRIKSDLDAAILAVPRLRSAIEEAQRKIEENEHTFQSQAANDLSQAQAELAKLAETIPALEDRVSRTTVRSPVKGIVKLIKVKTIGGVVQPGSELVNVVPTEDTLLVEAKILPKDIAFVTVGQPAVVKLTAYDFSIYGGLDGKIETVSADSIETEKREQYYTTEKGEPFYLVYVRTDKSTIAFKGKSLPVISGMTATVDVLTGRKSVLDYLLKPINKARERALRER